MYDYNDYTIHKTKTIFPIVNLFGKTDFLLAVLRHLNLEIK